jgi:HEAT repeat protein
MDTDRQYEKLINKLQHKNWRIRLGAVDELIARNDRSALKPLLDSIGQFDQDDEESLVNHRIQDALVAYGELAVMPLIEALKPDWDHEYDSWRRGWIVGALGRIKDRRAIEPLIAILGESEPRLVEEATLALGDLGDIRAIEALKAAQSRHTGTTLELINQALKKIVRASQQ